MSIIINVRFLLYSGSELQPDHAHGQGQCCALLTNRHMVRWWRSALVSPDAVAPSWMVGVSACVNLPLHHKVQKFSSGTSS